MEQNLKEHILILQDSFKYLKEKEMINSEQLQKLLSLFDPKELDIIENTVLFDNLQMKRRRREKIFIQRIKINFRINC